ncbi:MAG: PEP-CTERM sorting domain-containing protein [Verrucomicrobiales bacterium]|jgi:hypothetical protein|nr:PEP-CTERM sorting domain-containing protein [Verrucomicrobiales bacterium]
MSSHWLLKIIPLTVVLLAGAPAARAQMLSVYVGNTPGDLAGFEAWLGHPADGVQLHTGYKGWADYTGSVGWLRDVYAGVERQKFWSIPLIPEAEAATLSAAAGSNNGAYVTAWNTIASALVAGQPTGTIYVRTGWEFNANWFPWSALDGKAADYVATYRNFVTTFRAVSDRFVFEWCPNIGDQGMNPAEAYPGNDYVDIIGMDFYYNIAWDLTDRNGLDAWNYKVIESYGLQWLVDFAVEHDKPVAYSEWGVNNPNGTAYLAAFAEWLANSSVEVVYQNYWNSNAAFDGMLSDDQYPLLAAAYLEAFGQIPEPSVGALLAVGLALALGGWWLRRKIIRRQKMG